MNSFTGKALLLKDLSPVVSKRMVAFYSKLGRSKVKKNNFKVVVGALNLKQLTDNRYEFFHWVSGILLSNPLNMELMYGKREIFDRINQSCPF